MSTPVLLGASLVDIEPRGEFLGCADMISLPHIPQLSANSLQEISIPFPALFAKVLYETKSRLSGKSFIPMGELIGPWPHL